MAIKRTDRCHVFLLCHPSLDNNHRIQVTRRSMYVSTALRSSIAPEALTGPKKAAPPQTVKNATPGEESVEPKAMARPVLGRGHAQMDPCPERVSHDKNSRNDEAMPSTTLTLLVGVFYCHV